MKISRYELRDKITNGIFLKFTNFDEALEFLKGNEQRYFIKLATYIQDKNGNLTMISEADCWIK